MNGRRRGRAFPALCLMLAFVFAALGVWQVERRAWKLALIAAVDARLAAAPRAMPGAGAWRVGEEYVRVRVRGSFRHDGETLVQALTSRGAGWWVLTPLETAAGTVLVNRGYIPDERRDPRTRRLGQVAGPVSVTGLLRASEPRGTLLRSNDPSADRWYSRDVAAIAAARGIGRAMPFFIDADAAPNPGGYPIGGLTVVAFRNAHLVYALTWFALAALAAGGAALAFRQSWRR